MFTKTMPAFDATDLDYIETLPTGTVEPSAVLEAESMQEAHERELRINRALVDEMERLEAQHIEHIGFAIRYVLHSVNQFINMTACQIESELETLREHVQDIGLELIDTPSIISLVNASIYVIDSLLLVIDSNKEG